MNLNELLQAGLRCLAPPRVIGQLHYEAPVCLGSEVSFFGSCSIGAFTYLNNANVFTNCSIGRFCSLGHEILVGPGQHGMSYLSTHPFVSDVTDVAGLRCFEAYRHIAGERPLCESGPQRHPEYVQQTRIGNDVWIGSRVIIMNGLTIGDGAVIGAGAIVTKDVEPYSIVVGVPARVTRKRFTKEVIAALLELKWWKRDLCYLRDRVNYGDVPAIIDFLRTNETPPFVPACYTLRSQEWGFAVTNG